jgi:hypothetical protein
MFESKQLNGFQVDALALFLALAFSLSVSYYLWVLITELCVTCYPYLMFCLRNAAIDNENEESASSDCTSIDLENFDSHALGIPHTMASNPMISLQMQLESSNLLLAKQRDEIGRLKRLAYSNTAVTKAFSTVPRPPGNKKLKHDFESSGRIINPMINHSVMSDHK